MELPAPVLVNLRVIAKLQPGDRLQCTDSRYFGIDRSYFSFIMRWLKADSRVLALERLEETVNAACKYKMSTPLVRQLLANARTGVEHLIETYHTDPTTVSRLEALLLLCQSPTTDCGDLANGQETAL